MIERSLPLVAVATLALGASAAHAADVEIRGEVAYVCDVSIGPQNSTTVTLADAQNGQFVGELELSCNDGEGFNLAMESDNGFTLAPESGNGPALPYRLTATEASANQQLLNSATSGGAGLQFETNTLEARFAAGTTLSLRFENFGNGNPSGEPNPALAGGTVLADTVTFTVSGLDAPAVPN